MALVCYPFGAGRSGYREVMPGCSAVYTHQEALFLLPALLLFHVLDLLQSLVLLLLLKPAGQVPRRLDGVLLRHCLLFLLDCLSPSKRGKSSSHPHPSQGLP